MLTSVKIVEEMDEYSLRLEKRWFEAVKNGTKTVEGRLYRNKYQLMKPGDIITFINEKFSRDDIPDTVKTQIESLFLTDSFVMLYDQFGDDLLPKECLYGEELCNPPIVYDKINDYKQAGENGTKILGIRVRLI